MFEPPAVRCDVYTFKEGLLSAVGHDVKLTVGKVTVEVADGKITATFDAASLTVVCAMRAGAENPGALSDKDKRTIEGYVKEDVLHARRYPRIRFVSTEVRPEDDGLAIEGQLELHGRTRAVRAEARLRDDRWVTRVRLHQPDFGITPFKAMLGALRIQPHVEVEVQVPREAVS
jgi:polyisoprenoid-binding protein YceI